MRVLLQPSLALASCRAHLTSFGSVLRSTIAFALPVGRRSRGGSGFLPPRCTALVPVASAPLAPQRYAASTAALAAAPASRQSAASRSPRLRCGTIAISPGVSAAAPATTAQEHRLIARLSFGFRALASRIQTATALCAALYSAIATCTKVPRSAPRGFWPMRNDPMIHRSPHAYPIGPRLAPCVKELLLLLPSIGPIWHASPLERRPLRFSAWQTDPPNSPFGAGHHAYCAAPPAHCAVLWTSER